MRAAEGITYWRKPSKADKFAKEHQLHCTYGRAQKLLNVYLKSKLVCAGWQAHRSVVALHPPIDRALLAAMDHFTRTEREKIPDARGALEAAQQLGNSWTTFDKITYDAYIKVVKLIQGDRPLWAVEWLWAPSHE
ncbi:hypothetical protein D3C71_1560660 [compost metagenome]